MRKQVRLSLPIGVYRELENIAHVLGDMSIPEAADFCIKSTILNVKQNALKVYIENNPDITKDDLKQFADVFGVSIIQTDEPEKTNK